MRPRNESRSRRSGREPVRGGVHRSGAFVAGQDLAALPVSDSPPHHAMAQPFRNVGAVRGNRRAQPGIGRPGNEAGKPHPAVRVQVYIREHPASPRLPAWRRALRMPKKAPPPLRRGRPRRRRVPFGPREGRRSARPRNRPAGPCRRPAFRPQGVRLCGQTRPRGGPYHAANRARSPPHTRGGAADRMRRGCIMAGAAPLAVSLHVGGAAYRHAEFRRSRRLAPWGVRLGPFRRGRDGSGVCVRGVPRPDAAAARLWHVAARRLRGCPPYPLVYSGLVRLSF